MYRGVGAEGGVGWRFGVESSPHSEDYGPSPEGYTHTSGKSGGVQ